MINVYKLHEEIVSAGFEIGGVNSDGIVWGVDGKEIQDMPEVQALIAAHDPTEETVATLEEKIEALEAKLVGYDIMKSDIALLKGTITLTDK